MKSFVFLMLFSMTAQAYIPPSDYVMTRVAKSHGKGLYSLEQDAVFRSESETLTARESWRIQDADTMKLTVKSGALSLSFLFKDGRVYFIDDNDHIVSRKLSPESLERFFNARSEKTLSDLLMVTKILTVNPMRARPRPHDIKLIKPETDPYMRIVRLGEDPTILISSSQDAKDIGTAPGIWIDQESYTIRKIRFPSQAEVQASNYQTIGNDLIASRLRTVTWGQNSVEIRLVKATVLGKSKALESEFSTNSSALTPLQWGNSSLAALIKEFYQRFR